MKKLVTLNEAHFLLVSYKTIHVIQKFIKYVDFHKNQIYRIVNIE